MDKQKYIYIYAYIHVYIYAYIHVYIYAYTYIYLNYDVPAFSLLSHLLTPCNSFFSLSLSLSLFHCYF